MRSGLSFSREGTCRRPYHIAKSLELKYCFRSSLPKMLSNTAAQNITEHARKEKKEKKPGVEVKTETLLAVCLTINKNDTTPQALPIKHQEF